MNSLVICWVLEGRGQTHANNVCPFQRGLATLYCFVLGVRAIWWYWAAYIKEEMCVIIRLPNLSQHALISLIMVWTEYKKYVKFSYKIVYSHK